MDMESSELKLQVDVLAGLVADMDGENMHVLDVSGDILKKILGFDEITSRASDAARKASSVLEQIKIHDNDFDACYSNLCDLVNQISNEIDNFDNTETITDAVEEDTETLTDSAPEIPDMQETCEDSISMPEPDFNELETQLDVLECLVTDIAKNDSHVLGVIRDIFGKIGRIDSFPASRKTVVSGAEEVVDGMLSGSEGFETGHTKLISAAGEIRRLHGQIIVSGADESGRAGMYAGSVTADDRNSILAVFLEQQPALLDDFEQDILELESGKEEAYDSIRRYIHTLKGETGVLGLMEIQGFLHELESGLESPEILMRKEKITALLTVKDFLLEYIENVSEGIEEVSDKNRIKEILSVFPPPKKRERKEKKKSLRKVPIVQIDTTNPELFDFVSETNEYLNDAEIALMALERNPDDSDNLNAMFRVFHNIKGISGFLNLRDVNELAHNAENVLDDAREGRIRFTGECAESSYDAIDMFREMVDGVSAALSGAVYEVPAGYSELLDRLKSTVAGEVAVPSIKAPVPAPEAVASAEEEPAPEVFTPSQVKPEDKTPAEDVVKDNTPAFRKNIVDGMVKVSTARLDMLIDAVGELVISNSMVSQEPELQNTDNPRLSRNISQLGKITRELQELAMSMRMVSLAGTFHKMARVARDLSMKSGTQVDFTFSGEDTELDRNVVEEIGSPLVHMVRNSMDHGIEDSDIRMQLGKPERGNIHLHAYHEGGNVVIKVKDDGKGLSREDILKKAVSMGLVKEKADMSDKEIYGLIMNAGFSTAKAITDVSGRGVGMDVVKKAIENLRGRIDIETEPGKGTTFYIRLPLTLAIIDGMVVTSGAEKYIIPTITIVESLRPAEGQVKSVVGKGEMLKLRGEMVPLFRLYKLFGNEGAVKDPMEAILVIISGYGGSRCAIMVDELVDQQQVVIKSLGETFKNVDGISGGAIMGDGKVSIILDTAGIVRLAQNSD